LGLDLEQQKQSSKKDKKIIPTVYCVTSAGLATDTRVLYGQNINRFLNHFQIKDIEPLKEYSLQHCKQMVIDYVIFLRDDYHKQFKPQQKPLSSQSIKLHLAAIRHFFFMIREDEFPIKWTKINIELPPNEYTYRDRGYSVQEIQVMLEKGCQGRLREKVVVLLLTSAGGLRIGAIHKLKKCHLKEMYTSTGEKTYGIQIYAESSEDYFTPCSPECASTIDRYLEERAKDGETIKHDSPLIRNLYNSLSVKRPKHLSKEGVKNIVSNIVRLSGIRKNFEFKGQVKMSRGFRKFYKSEADLSGMLPATVELTQGHSIGIPGHYLRLKDTEILQDYEKVIDRITLSKEFRLTKRNEELETGQAQEIASLKAQLEETDLKLRQTVQALEIKSKNSIDKIEKQIFELNGMIVEMTTDNEHGGCHYYKYKKA
jgi:site-specific recombinase XerD